jgi:hypothetical protein
VTIVQKLSDFGKQACNWEVFVPDEAGVLTPASQLVYNDAPWNLVQGDVKFVHPKISHDVAAKVTLFLLSLLRPCGSYGLMVYPLVCPGWCRVIALEDGVVNFRHAAISVKRGVWASGTVDGSTEEHIGNVPAWTWVRLDTPCRVVAGVLCC